MHVRTAELTTFLARHRATLAASVDQVPAADRDTPPAADVWSVANILEHLARVEGRIVAGLSGAVAGSRAGLDPAPNTSVIGETDFTRYLNRERRLVATEAARPAAGLSAAAAWARLEEVRGSTLALLRETDGLELTPVVFPHPIFGLFNFYQWMVFLGGHEGRHAGQIGDVGRALARRP